MIRYILLSLFVLSLFSCGTGELTKDKAESVLEECLDGNTFSVRDKIETSTFTSVFGLKHHYKKRGLIQTRTVIHPSSIETLMIEPTGEGKEYVEDYDPEKDEFFNALLYTFEIKELASVHNDPYTNSADVKVIFERKAL